MPYKPSKELMDKIAKEYCLLMMSEASRLCDIPMQKEIDISKYADINTVFCCPTILKALEQIDDKPQWQDNPDKEGWWWGRHKNTNGFDYFMVRMIKHKNKYVVDRNSLCLPLSTYMGFAYDAEWLYVPEPNI